MGPLSREEQMSDQTSKEGDETTAAGDDINVDLGDGVSMPPTVPVSTQNGQSTSDIDVDLSSSSTLGIRTSAIPPKEAGARWVASAIVITFGSCLGLLLLLGFGLLFWLRWSPDKLEPLFQKGVIPFVEKVGTFASTVFGPLLAFILGYYFGEKGSK